MPGLAGSEDPLAMIQVAQVSDEPEGWTDNGVNFEIVIIHMGSPNGRTIPANRVRAQVENLIERFLPPENVIKN